MGTRGSRLALTQTRLYCERLSDQNPSLEFEIVEIQTSGDRFQERPTEDVLRMAGKGIFVKEIEEALLRGDVDFAVHSLKDMPGDLPDGLLLCGYQPRGDPRDALVTFGRKDIADLPNGARVGSSSLRRRFQLIGLMKALGKTVEVLPVRGNLDTRVTKALKGELDAVIVSAAGLRRLGLIEHAVKLFDPSLEMIPPCGQGILTAEISAARADLFEILSTVEDHPTRLSGELERRVLKAMGGGCLDALGIYARPRAEEPGAMELHLYRHSGQPGEEDLLRTSLVVRAQDTESLFEKLTPRQ